MSDSILNQLANIVGAERVVTGAELSGYEFPWSTHDDCRATAAVFPASTEQVSTVLAFCNQNRQTVVPFGGTTNLVQGCATESGDIVLSLARM
ncbi:MAG TPA: FAD-binding protein, partial [Woeseiaceae bacterium]|nr:FAD-binding protein [Woeseiaceae bacterium]